MRRSTKPDWQKRIAKERIEILLNLAEKEFKKHPQRSKRYVELARKISLRYNVRLSKKQKKKFCKNCFILLAPSTSRVRLDSQKKTIVVKCLSCHKVYKEVYK